MRVQGLAQRAYRFGQVVGEVAVLPRAEAVAGHVDRGTEQVRLLVLGDQAAALVCGEQPGRERADLPDRAPRAADAIPVQVQAGQFAFYFRYPGPDGKFGPLHPEKINEANQNIFGLDVDSDPASKDDIVTAEMGVPVNKEVRLLMHAKDVGHSFYVRELRIQQDFVPGLDLQLHFTATKVGRYEIVCTQLCGLGHYNMKAYLNVMSQPDYDAWIKQQAPKTAAAKS